MERLRRAAITDPVIAQFAGRWMDHLPMTAADWAVTERALEQVRAGAWGQGHRREAVVMVVAFEVGGVGPLWEALTDERTLAEQVPRLAAWVRGSPEG